MNDIDELIAEARECGPARNADEYLIERLADALEAATSERDALTQRVRRLKNRELRATEKRDAALARIAELEATVDAQDRQIEARSGETAAERMFKEELLKAKARIAEAAKLHLSFTAPDGTFCKTCEWVEWPCPTAVALGLNEG